VAYGDIVGIISDTLVSKGGQMVASALNLRGSDPNEPSIIGLFDWQEADDPNGEEHMVEVAAHPGAATFPEGGPLPAAGRPEEVEFKFPFRSRYAVTLTANKTQLKKLALAEKTQQNKILNFVTRRFASSFDATVHLMEGHLIQNDPDNGGVVDGFTGLDVVAQTDNLYGAIDANVYPITGAVVNTNGSARPLTLDLMDDMDQAIRDAGGRYDVILASTYQIRKYTKLDGSAAANRGVGIVQQAFSTDMPGLQRHFSAGWVSASYGGKPIVRIQDFPTDVMDFARRENMKGKVLRNWEVETYKKEEHWKWTLTFEAEAFVELRRKSYARLEALD
jgi:hypothetical protein